MEMDCDEDTKLPKGQIFIDGVNIANLGLHELRKMMTIIPQDPVMFEGSVQFNVDPVGNYTRQEIVDSIKKVQVWDSLVTLIKSTHEKNQTSINNENAGSKLSEKQLENKVLDFIVESNGDNLSQGQKQLICIARAIVVKPKILLMDEATANIDEKTDKTIQDVIKHEFSTSTIITIAHRLNTIIQFDKIVVLDKGTKDEEGTPLQLLDNENSYLYQLVMENGKDFFNQMRELA